jgi:putative NADH-flavin reductase
VATSKTIALFGATGRTGQLVLEQLVAQGYTVRALVRRAGVIDARDGAVTVVVGDVRDSVSVEDTIRGADVVVSVFGQVKGSSPTVQTDGTRTIVEAMDVLGIRRIVSLSGGALPDEQHDRPKFADRVFRFLLERISPHVLADARSHLKVLRDSGVEWTVVRAPRLTDSVSTGSYRLGWVGVNASTQIARADLARFIVAQVEDSDYVHQLPFVSR